MKHQSIVALICLLTGSAASAHAADPQSTTTDSPQQLAISHEADRPTRSDLSKYFTGKALVNPLFSAEGDSHATGAIVTFEPGARTHWHSHPVGQQLVITHGVGWVQMEGQPKQTVHAGDVVWIPAHVNHWHGATADHSMTHIAIQERRNGSNVSWNGPVSDTQYNAE